jgi:hypothetical protein
MDELDFETRLRARLRRRFDGIQPSHELVAGVEQTLATRPQPIGMAVLRARRRELGWAVFVAAGLVLAIVLSGGRLGGPFGPGAPSTSPQSPDGVLADRNFIVLPPAGHDPSKGVDSAAADVLIERLRALLFAGDSPNAFSSGGGYAITFRLPRGGPSDESIRTVLRASGDLAFMSLPSGGSDGAGGAAIGQNPPADAVRLFGWDGVASAAMETGQQGEPALSITLRPAAAQAFSDFTSAHIGETFAIVIDDDVALLPVINEAITDGMLQVSGGGGFVESAAIIVGGKLPDAWIVPTVPEVLPPSAIEHELEFQFSKVEPRPATVDLAVTDASLTSILEGRRVVAVWYIKLDGLAAVCPSALPSDERGICRWTDPSIQHVFDAETGEWLGTAADFDEST